MPGNFDRSGAPARNVSHARPPLSTAAPLTLAEISSRLARLTSCPPVRPGSCDDRTRLLRVASALLFAAEHTTTNERASYASIRRSLMMCVRALENSEPTRMDLAAMMPWENSVGEL